MPKIPQYLITSLVLLLPIATASPGRVRCSALGETTERQQRKPEVLCGVFHEQNDTLSHLIINKVKYNSRGTVEERLTQSAEMRPSTVPDVFCPMASTKVYDPENKVKCFAYEPNSNKLQAGFGVRSYGLHDLLPMKVEGDENLLASDLPEIKVWKFGNNSEPWYVKVYGDDIIEMDGEDPTKEAVWREVLGSDRKMHVMFGRIPRRRERDPAVPIIVVRRELSYFTSFSILRAVTGQERHDRLRDFKALELRELKDDWTSVDLVTRMDEDFVKWRAANKDTPDN